MRTAEEVAQAIVGEMRLLYAAHLANLYHTGIEWELQELERAAASPPTPDGMLLENDEVLLLVRTAIRRLASRGKLKELDWLKE